MASSRKNVFKTFLDCLFLQNLNLNCAENFNSKRSLETNCPSQGVIGSHRASALEILRYDECNSPNSRKNDL